MLETKIQQSDETSHPLIECLSLGAQLSGDVDQLQLRGRQFSRFGYAFTPACGSEEVRDARGIYGPTEVGPFRGSRAVVAV